MSGTTQEKYKSKAAQTFQEGDENWKKGEYDSARQSYEKAAFLYHEDEDFEGEAFVLARLGELELSMEDLDRAEKSLRSAAELVKNLPEGQNTYADSLIKLSKLEASRGDLGKAMEIVRLAQHAAEAINNFDLQGEAFDHEAYI